MKVYREAETGGTYYRVVYHLDGERIRQNFADLHMAITEAETQASGLSRGVVDTMRLTAAIRLSYGLLLKR